MVLKLLLCLERGCQTLLQLQQGVQGLQGFVFCVLTINDEHTKQT